LSTPGAATISPVQQSPEAREFDAKIMQIRESQLVMFEERDRLNERARELQREYAVALAELRRFQVKIGPFIPPRNVAELSPASRRYGFIMGGLAKWTTVVQRLQKEIQHVEWERQNLRFRATQLEMEYRDLEKTRPAGAVLYPYPAR
jgi:hypothetical protein